MTDTKGDNMLTVTDSAMEHFQKSVDSLTLRQGGEKCVRMKPGRRAGLELVFEKPAPTDKMYRRDGRVVFAVPRKIGEMCRDKTLDLDDSGRLKLA